MSYWSDDTPKTKIQMIYQRENIISKENTELKKEIQKLTIKIEKLESELAFYKVPDGRWNWYGSE